MQIHAEEVENKLLGSKSSTDAMRLLSFYSDAPQEELTMDEFETYAFDRLRLLRKVEEFRTRGFTGNELETKMNQLIRTYMPTKDQRKDIVSHFILRLVFCKSEDDRRWFLSNECILFKHRLDSLTPVQRKEFMAGNGLTFDAVSPDERNTLREQLIGLAGVNENNLITSDFYKVPYTQALSLVSKREVFLQAGFAYVPLNRLVSTIVARFRTSLARALSEANNMSSVVRSDSRIEPLLKGMKKANLAGDFSKGEAVDKLTLGNIDSRAEQNMPLCMKHLHTGLKREHKLKHWGRLQYGLFLKGAGLELDDAVQFWESHFSKIMPHDAFQKNYSYSFRHMYGKEGARKNYTPYSCMKIIMGSPPEMGAYHGCPYRHMPETQLVSLLGSLSIGGKDLQEIISKANSNHPQLACQKHFDVTHPDHEKMQVSGVDSVANHPNAWIKASIAYEKIKTAVDDPSKVNSVNSTTTVTPASENKGATVEGFNVGVASAAITPAAPAATA
jgi:DNA primase large subunit